MNSVRMYMAVPEKGRIEQLGRWVGFFGLVAMALVTVSTSVAYLGALLLLIGFVLCIREWFTSLRQEPVLMLSGGLVAYVSVLGAISLSCWKGYEAAVSDGIFSYIYFLVLIPPIAWFLRGDINRIRLVLVLALIGMLARIAIHTDFDDLEQTFHGRYYGFGLSHITFGMYINAALLGLAILGANSLSQTRSLYIRLMLGALMLLVVALLAQALVATQSRAAWITLAVVGPPMVAWFFWDRWSNVKRSDRAWTMIGTSVLIAVVVILIGYFNLDRISARMAQEKDTIHGIASLDRERIPADSVGTRYHMVLFGLERIGERPFFGWGPGSTRLVQIEYEGHQWWYREGRNLHNTYIHVALELGLVGFVGFAALLVMILRYTWQVLRGGAQYRVVGFWTLGAIVMLLLWSATAYRLDKADIRFFTAILLGIPLSLYWAHVRCVSSMRNNG